MIDQNLPLRPPERLVLAYARPDLRAALELLLTFDGKLADIVGSSREPMISQMKIAWWNDVIAKAPAHRPKGEPMLAALGGMDSKKMVPSMQLLLDAWGLLAAHEHWDDHILSRFAQARSEAIFATYARSVGSGEDTDKLGIYWAVADLRSRFGGRVQEPSLPDIPDRRTSRALRPLSILAKSVTMPTGVQMLWHALTGR
jgi:15-cis-phytoene synthase